MPSDTRRKTGSGSWISTKSAEDWVQKMNRECPNIQHRIEINPTKPLFARILWIEMA